MDLSKLAKREAKYVISELSFIKMILKLTEQYNQEEKDYVFTLLVKYDPENDGQINFEQFTKMFKDMKESISPAKLLELFNDCMGINSDISESASYESVYQMMQTYKLGDYGNGLLAKRLTKGIKIVRGNLN